MVTTAAVPPTRRETWPDVAKGVCIVLVVLWHVVTKHYQRIDWDTSVPWSAAWGTLGEQLLPLRMPLFFTISGLFAVGVVARPWPVLTRTRVAGFFYLYAVWLLIHTAVMWWTPTFDTARARSAGDLLEQLTISPTNLWYLFALAAYFAIARATRRVPTAWLLTAAMVLSAVAAADLLPVVSNRGQVYQNLVFFLAGLRLRPAIESFASASSVRRLVATCTAYVAALAAMAALGAQRWPGVWPAVSVLAIAVGVVAAVMVARHLTRTTRALSGLGRRTLPVYVMHLPLLAVADRLLRGPLAVLEPRTALVAALEPVVLTGVLIAVCLLLERIVRQVGARWLLEMPGSKRPAAVARSAG
ncbi:acyltransferase family protein [Aeromicrobium endophyticum]|uniref:Acyltransferase n=1 Tax=Aeromicrobium endophyticum TaxID=2292704 RepID=A0A371P1Z1_9ACTN|nr:acyltransferase family protein [Aeromicrobium endophyticum]REK69969.1 acyltransferase [Aeromicrobium endophyticum]